MWKTWKSIDFAYNKHGVPYWDKPRFLKNYSKVFIFCTLIEKTGECGEIVYFELNKELKSNKPIYTDILGVLSGNPITLESGRTLILVHNKNSITGYYEQHIYYSDDMKTWHKTAGSLKMDGHNFSDSEIIQVDYNNLLMIIRESSPSGWDLFRSISQDGGKSWSRPTKLPFRGGHNPSIDVNNDSLFIAFSQDNISHKCKPISIAKVNLIDLMTKHLKVNFEIILEHDSLSSYGYGGISVLTEELLIGAKYIKSKTFGCICIDEIIN